MSAGDMTPFNASIVIDMGAYGQNGYTTHKRDLIPSIQPELRHTTIGALARTVDEYDFVVHPGDFAYADDWYYNTTNLLDEKNVFEAILEVTPACVRSPPCLSNRVCRTFTTNSLLSPAASRTWRLLATTRPSASRTAPSTST